MKKKETKRKLVEEIAITEQKIPIHRTEQTLIMRMEFKEMTRQKIRINEYPAVCTVVRTQAEDMHAKDTQSENIQNTRKRHARNYHALRLHTNTFPPPTANVTPGALDQNREGKVDPNFKVRHAVMHRPWTMQRIWNLSLCFTYYIYNKSCYIRDESRK